MPAVSLHNPSVSGTQDLDVEELGGMLHAGARSVRDRYPYISDSNGYWRFERLPEVLAAGEHERLHVLTHPEWWQEEAMSPRDRIMRASPAAVRRRGPPMTMLLATTSASTSGCQSLPAEQRVDDRQSVRRVEVLRDQLDSGGGEPLVLLIAAGTAARQVGGRRRPRARSSISSSVARPSTSSSEARTIGVVIPSVACRLPRIACSL